MFNKKILSGFLFLISLPIFGMENKKTVTATNNEGSFEIVNLETPLFMPYPIENNHLFKTNSISSYKDGLFALSFALAAKKIASNKSSMSNVSNYQTRNIKVDEKANYAQRLLYTKDRNRFNSVYTLYPETRKIMLSYYEKNLPQSVDIGVLRDKAYKEKYGSKITYVDSFEDFHSLDLKGKAKQIEKISAKEKRLETQYKDCLEILDIMGEELKNNTCFNREATLENVSATEFRALKIRHKLYSIRCQIKHFKNVHNAEKIRSKEEHLLPMGKRCKIAYDTITKTYKKKIIEDKSFKVIHIKISGNTTEIENNTLHVSPEEVLSRVQQNIEILAHEYGFANNTSENLIDTIDTVEYHQECNYEENQVCVFYYSSQEENTKERITALEIDLKNGNQSREQIYVISKKLEQALIEKGINPDSFTMLVGNESQHIEHKQNIEAASIILNKEDELGDLTNIGLDFICTANSYNAVGNIIKANECTDFCYILADYATAISEGARDGVINVADMLIHPVETTKGMATGAVYLGAFLGDFITNSADVVLHKLANVQLNLVDQAYKSTHKTNVLENAKDFTQERLDTGLTDLKNTTHAIYTSIDTYIKTTPRRELVKQGTTLVTELILTRAACKNILGFLEKAKPSIVKFAKYAKEVAKGEKLTLATAEGINIPIVYHTVETTKYLNRQARKLAKKATKLKKTTKKAGDTLKPNLVEVGKRVRVLRKFHKGCTNSEAIQTLEKFGKKIIIKCGKTLGLLEAKGFIDNGFTFTINYWQHVLGLEHTIEKYASGTIRIIKHGGHYVKNKALKIKVFSTKTNKIIECKIPNTKIKTKGMKVFVKSHKSLKTCFPREWPKDMVKKKIIESLKNIGKETKFIEQTNGYINFISKTNCGIEIKHVIDKTGKLITSFPFLE